MHVVIGALLLAALMFLLGDVINSAAALSPTFVTLADVVVRLAAAHGIDWNLAELGHGSGEASVLRAFLTAPAFTVFAVLASIGLIVDARWKRRSAAGSASLPPPPDRAPPPVVDAAPRKHPAIASTGGKSSAVQMPAPPRPPKVVEQPRPAALDPLLTAADDREFLPAALEILITPPSPKATAMLTTICGGMFVALAWSYLSWIDIHAIAVGKVQPSGRSKVVQPLEPGKIIAIRVENGTVVNAGDVLLELDAAETGADRQALARDLEGAKAEAARREAAISAARQPSQGIPQIAFEPATGEVVRRREISVLLSDLTQLRSTVASISAQLREKQATKQRLTASIASRQKLIALAKERVSMRTQAEALGAGSRALVIEVEQQYETQMTTDIGERGQLIEADAAINSLERKIDEVTSQFIADQQQKIAEAERKRDRMTQDLIKAETKNDRTQLKAPIAGTVQQLTVTTVGQVVGSGQSLLTIVPLDGPIEVEAMISNKDIGFVEVGQPGVVKVDAFPFSRYGTLDGTVAKLSRDAVDDRDASTLTDVSRSTKSQGANPAASPQSSNLVFPATIRLAQRSLSIDGKTVPLMPGMSVTVEIKTGQRRAIDFLLSPLREITAQTAHER